MRDVFARYRIGAKMYRSALAVSNAGTASGWVRNAQVVITKAILWHCHSEPAQHRRSLRACQGDRNPGKRRDRKYCDAFRLTRENSHGRCSAVIWVQDIRVRPRAFL